MARKPRVMRCLCVFRWCSSTRAISRSLPAPCETRVMRRNSSRACARAVGCASAHLRMGLHAFRRRGTVRATLDGLRRGRVCAFAASARVSTQASDDGVTRPRGCAPSLEASEVRPGRLDCASVCGFARMLRMFRVIDVGRLRDKVSVSGGECVALVRVRLEMAGQGPRRG